MASAVNVSPDVPSQTSYGPSYVVTAVTPTGYTADTAIAGPDSSSTPGGPGILTGFVVQPGGSDPGNDFPEIAQNTASLSGTVFAEPSKGSPDYNPTDPAAGEAPLPGVTLTLYNSDGQTVAQTTSGSDGTYDFTNLPAGGYQIVETTLPSGYSPDTAIPDVENSGTGGTGQITGISLVATQQSSGNDFPDVAAPSSLSGYVFGETSAGSPAYDPSNPAAGEAPLTGASLQLIDSGGQVLQTVATNSSGFYQFTNLSGSNYTIRLATGPTLADDDTAIVGTQGGTAGTAIITGVSPAAGSFRHRL